MLHAQFTSIDDMSDQTSILTRHKPDGNTRHSDKVILHPHRPVIMLEPIDTHMLNTNKDVPFYTDSGLVPLLLRNLLEEDTIVSAQNEIAFDLCVVMGSFKTDSSTSGHDNLVVNNANVSGVSGQYHICLILLETTTGHQLLTQLVILKPQLGRMTELDVYKMGLPLQ